MINIDKFAEQKQTGDSNIVTKRLIQIAEEDIKRLPERVFVGVFLPVFAGDEQLHYNVNMETWLNYAGSPYKSVHVVDRNDNILFTVPPLLNREAVNPVKPSDYKVPISSVVTTAGQIANQSPRQGLRYLTTELTKRALIMKVPGNVLKDLAIWNSIFTRYGRLPIVELTADQKKIINNTTDEVDDTDDFEFISE
jgi:hypothetical protein